MRRILAIEDSRQFQALVRNALSPEFDLVFAPDLAQASIYLEGHQFDLVLLDVSLPDGNGFDFCARVRDFPLNGQTPVFLLTGKSEIHNKVLGFTLGAEDYIVKPFDPLELRARVLAKVTREKEKSRERTILEKGNLRIDFTQHSVFLTGEKQNKRIELTPVEFKLLSYLVHNEGVIVTRGQILDSIWSDKPDIFARAIDKHICTLRAKLHPYSHYVKTVPTVGYQFITNENSSLP